MSTEEIKALAHRFHMDIFQKGDLAVADEILGRDFINHFPGYPPEWQRGPEGVKKLATAIRTAFPDDARITHEETLVEGDKVVIRWKMSGTQKGDMFGIPPTGKQMTVTGIDIFRIAGGKIVEFWQNWDQLGMMQQLGVVPPPGQAKK